MDTAIVVFTRDLRLHDNPALHQAYVRARMVTASFLTRNLGIDWRHGLAHFDSLLADGDVANNAGNWQWVAGTGNNTRPNRVMNPLRQAQRFDPAGDYVRRYVPELAAQSRKDIHTPDSPYWPGP